jgi:beta-xylosidase
VHWEYVSHALEPLVNPPAFSYWAPEVAQHNGKFYLYYSASHGQSDEHHRLRVAVANHPSGPFVDAGKMIFPDGGFSIDASPFLDPKTGRWYLYFAVDYLNNEPHGTGLAVIPLADDLVTPLAPPRMVMRAKCPWQIYERDRDYKGRVWKAWHCIEGPFVVFHDERYWCLYSGGNWQNESYGIGFAVASDPMGPWSDDFAEHGPTVLKGVPGSVIGPGHASVVAGPNDSLLLVYHAWDAQKSARRMCIDPLHFTPQGPRCDGPSVGLQLLGTNPTSATT